MLLKVSRRGTNDKLLYTQPTCDQVTVVIKRSDANHEVHCLINHIDRAFTEHHREVQATVNL
ncbi:hypothetical protein Cthiooxydans_46960 [Comamonas thiooxydans]|nr:hypothetical protein Cthiooxydans_46960 [Comamonas thiooxydans]